jgi:hypothetical protein
LGSLAGSHFPESGVRAAGTVEPDDTVASIVLDRGIGNLVCGSRENENRQLDAQVREAVGWSCLCGILRAGLVERPRGGTRSGRAGWHGCAW